MEQFDPYQEWLDIPREERPIDHYRLLGIGQFESRREVIERAADKRMAHVRKFQMGPRGRSTQNLLNELSTAKLCLLGTDSRERYDATLRMPASPAPQPAPTAPSPAAQLAAPPQPSSQTPVPPPIGTMDQPPVAADAEPPPPPGPAPPPGPSPPRRSPAGASLRKTASVAARRRRRASSAGCMLILGAIGLVIGGFAFLLVVSRPNPAGVTREQLATDDPPPVEVEEPSGPVVVMQEGNGSVNLSAAVAVLHGESLKLSNGDESTIIANWDSTDQWVQWQFRLVKPGVFQVDVHYTIDEDAAGGSFELLVDDRVVKVCSLRSPDAANAEVVDHYFVPIARSGRHSLAVRPTRKPGKEFMRLFQVRLIPKQGGLAES